MSILNVGDSAPVTGIYNVIDSYGRIVNTISMEKGYSFPPTSDESYRYELRK